MDSVRETMMKLMQSQEVDWRISRNRERLKDLVSAAKRHLGMAGKAGKKLFSLASYTNLKMQI